MVLAAPDPTHSVWFIHVSRLSGHTQDLLKDGRVSLMLALPDTGEKDPQQLARLTLTGDATELSDGSAEEDSAKEIYLAKFPHMAEIVGAARRLLVLGDPAEVRPVRGRVRARVHARPRRAARGDRGRGAGVTIPAIPGLATHDVVPLLQVAVGPVILISGVGLLLLSMTNRFGRLIDRSRQLSRELRTASDDDRTGLIAQVRILMARARLVRLAIALATTSLLLAALLIILLFLTALFGLRARGRPLPRLHRVHGVSHRVAPRLPARHQRLAARLQAGDRVRRPAPPLTKTYA